MAGVLQSTVSTYEFSLDQMKDLIATDLGIPKERISVEFVVQDVSDDRYHSFTNFKCTKVVVTVSHVLGK